MCNARSVVPQRKVVVTNLGEIAYDYLVVATGCDTNFFGNDSLRETTFPLKSVSESILMRNRLFLSFEEALSIQDEQELSDKLTFIIVGGGATGVELSGTLAEMRQSILPKDYPADLSLLSPLFKVRKRMYLDDHDEPIFFYNANLKRQDKEMIEKQKIYH